MAEAEAEDVLKLSFILLSMADNPPLTTEKEGGGGGTAENMRFDVTDGV